MPDRTLSGSSSSHSWSSSVSEYPPLKVLIAGAGIGGLAAAIGLKRQGHEVHIFEQSRLANEVGAAIHIAPNSNRLLRRFGVKLEDGYGAQVLTALSEFDPNGVLTWRLPIPDANKVYGAPYHLMHRGLLHSALKDKALEMGVHLHTSSRVNKINPKTAELFLIDGTRWNGDVIVGADGLHSRTRSAIPGAQNIEPTSGGRCAFRFLLPMSKIYADPVISRFVINEGECFKIHLGKGRVIVCYPCVSNTILNCLAACPAEMVKLPAKSNQDWNHTIDKKHMLDIFSDICAPARAIFEKADDDSIRLWELMDMEEMPTWVHERLALLGDAAHPFTPWRGQGGSMAIEDGAAIAALLPMGTTPTEIPERFNQYHDLRRERAHLVQDVSRKSGGLLYDTQTRVGMEHIDQMAFERNLLSYDVWAHAEKVLKG